MRSIFNPYLFNSEPVQFKKKLGVRQNVQYHHSIVRLVIFSNIYYLVLIKNDS